jgi:excisionase family DNA binding protein
MPTLYKPAELAQLLNISRATAYRLIGTGELPSIRIGGKILVAEAQLLQYLGDLIDAA